MDGWKLSLCQTNSFPRRTVLGRGREFRTRMDVLIRVTPSYTADFFIFVFWDVSCVALVPVLELYKRPSWSRIYKDLPASTSRVLGLKASATTARLFKCVAQAGLELVILLLCFLQQTLLVCATTTGYTADQIIVPSQMALDMHQSRLPLYHRGSVKNTPGK